MADRTSAFLVDLYNRLAERVIKNKLTSEQAVSHHPVLGKMSFEQMPDAIQQCRTSSKTHVDSNDNVDSNFVYAGHVMIVSHGGWIRHMLRLLALQSEESYGFPRECVNSVMRNCGICQVGVLVDQTQWAQSLASNHPIIVNSPLPVFGTLTETGGAASSCAFYSKANRRLPMSCVCYHFNLTRVQLESMTHPTTTINGTLPPAKAEDPAETLCSEMEVIFADDGDEYAGQPDHAPPETR